MGDLIGGLIGGIGSLVGSSDAANAEKAAAKQALTGFNYLNGNPLINGLQTNGLNGSNGEAGTVGSINSLLTSPNQNNPAFQNYLNSTGYQFQLGQGENAITGNAASKGLLSSGATGKALTQFGQNLASTSFNNYLGQLGGLAGLQGNQAQQGLAAADAVGQAGTTGGGNAGVQTAAAGVSSGTGINNAFNVAGGGIQSWLSGGGGGNFFGGGGGNSVYPANAPPTPVPF